MHSQLIGSCDESEAILFIGSAVQDVVITVPGYPKEDSVLRTVSTVHRQRGGDASSSAVVYSLLQKKIGFPNKKDVYFMGALATEEKSKFIIDDFKKYSNINYSLCYFNDQNTESITFAILNSKTGSRTILNKKIKFELSFKQFEDMLHIHLSKAHTQDLSQLFNLVFFEFQWVCEMSKMVEYIKKTYKNQIKIAVEMETNRFKDKEKWIDTDEMLQCVDKVILLSDIIFFSGEYIESLGFLEDDPIKFIKYFVNKMNSNKNNKIIVIPWGSKGAYCLELNNPKNIIFCKSYNYKSKVIDTLGAGDTFNGSFLFAFRQGFDLKGCCDFACKCAGYKVGYNGFDCIANFDIHPSNICSKL